MKRILTAVAVLILLGTVGLTVLLWTPYKKAKHSCEVWKSLQLAINENKWNEVEELLADTERDLHEIEENRIIYFGTEDYTDQIAKQSVDFRDTVLYYLTDPRSEETDKVEFPSGYALIHNDRVTFIKYP